MTELTISSTALIIVVLTLRHFLKGRIGLRLQYALWALVLVRLLVPVNLYQSPISVLNAMRTSETAVASSESALEEPMNTAPLRTDALFNLNAVPAPQKVTPDRGKLLNLVWYTGIAAVGLCLFLSNLSFAIKLRKVRISFPANDYRLKVYIVENLPSPCLYGLFSPAVYITAEVAGDKTSLCHVLTHELCHYRHGDHIWSALRSLCLAVYWFNPFVWLAAGVSRRDAELSCDESTITRLGEENRMEYGRTLIGLTCQKHGAMDLLCCATTMLDSKKGIQERIALIVKKPKTAVCTLAAVLIILAVTAGCTFTDAKPEEETASAGTPLTETADSAQSPGVTAATYSHGYNIYDGKNPLSKEELQKATWLTISNVDSLDFLRDAPNLTHLRAGNGALYEGAESVSGDISALSGLTNLQSINLLYANVTGDIGSLSGLEKLQELDLRVTNVSGDLSTLSGLEKLRIMSLTYASVTGDLGALKGMSALEAFDLRGDGITGDLSDLSGLSNLRDIGLSSTPNVKGDISILKGFHLNSIHLNETNIAIDLSALSGISGLSTVDLASDNISGDLSALSGISGLSTVDLASDNISGDLSDLRGMSDLRYILLSGKDITGNLSALSGLSDLKYIALSSTPIVTGDLSMLKGCANLTGIVLDETNITADLSALSGHTLLTSLNLSTTNVSGDIGSLSGLAELNYLNLSSTAVSGDIGALDDLAKLSDIDFADTNITGHT